jgi:hypothetical protein
MMLRSAAIGVLGLLLGGCELFSGGFEYGSVRVRATDRGGAPVPGVTATLYAPDYVVGTAVTDADGVAVITQVAPREFALRIAAPATHLLTERSDTVFAQRRDTILYGVRVGAGEDREVQLPLRAACCGTLRVRAVDPSGAPVAGTIAVPYTTTVAYADTAGADGIAIVGGLDEGVYALRVRAPASFAFASGIDTIVYNVRIREGAETRRDVVIRRAP